MNNLTDYENELINLEDETELITNAAKRVPVCLCLDTSGSMRAENNIDKLNDGIGKFYNAIREDEVALDSAEISIITFGDTVKVERDFKTVSEFEEETNFIADGLTPMSQAILDSLDLLEERKEEYKKYGRDYYQPWIVIMSDGALTDNDLKEKAKSRILEMERNNKINVIPIAIVSDPTTIPSLSEFTQKRKPVNLLNTKFTEFFEWLSRSIGVASRSNGNEALVIENPVEAGWGSFGA